MKIGTSSSQPVRDLLASANIRLLHNEHATETTNGREINLVGVGDLWNDECDPKAAFSKLDGTRPTLLLSHNPDTKDLMQGHPWDLMLCGHTHGGQVFLPGLGAPLAPVKDKRYVRGLHRLGDRWMHISKGVGNLHGVRLNCRPEVSLLNIT
jgi:predicted MPP superfamily phosphohydrolase